MTRGDWGAALTATALALVVRLLGIRFGLPWFHHWDESWITDSAAHMLQRPWWEPSAYHYGAPLPMAIAASVRMLTHLFPEHLFDPNDGVLMRVIGRVITAVISSSGAFATYVAARHATVGDRGARLRAIYAAIAYATSAELVTNGRYAVTDADIVALVAWTLAFGALFARDGRLRWASAMVASGAAAVAFKVTAGPVMLVPAALLYLRRPHLGPKQHAKALALMLAFGLVVFFALNPNMLFHWSKAVGNINSRMNQYARGGVPEFVVRRRGPEHLAAILHALAFRVFHRWPWASAAMATLALGGTIRAMRVRSRVVLAGVIHASVVVVGLSIASRAFLLRNYLVVIPVACIGFAFAMEWIHERARRRAFVLALAASFAALFVVVPCAQAVEDERLTTDARARAVDWIVAHQTTRFATVAFTWKAIWDASGSRGELREALARPSLVVQPEVGDVEGVLSRPPTYVVSVSRPDDYGRGDVWPFVSVPGYREVARFDPNPWEHDFRVTPTWAGRYGAIVLQRE